MSNSKLGSEFPENSAMKNPKNKLGAESGSESEFESERHGIIKK